MNWFVTTILSLLLAFSAGGCGRPMSTPSATENSPVPRPRIVSLAPNLTELICALGAGDLLVGRSSACKNPADIVRQIPVVGGFGVPTYERVVAVKPTLVLDVALADESMGRKLAELGLRRQRIACRTLGDVPLAMEELGRLTGRDADGIGLATEFRRTVEEFRRQLPPVEQRPRVLAVIWTGPVMVAGRESLVSDLVSLAGGRNVGDEFAKDYVQVSLEWIAACQPDMILCFYDTGGRDPVELLRGRAGWSSTPAVEKGNVFGGFDLDLMLTPGPRVLQGVPILRERLTRAAQGVSAGTPAPATPKP